jgi:thiosulfate/3-mercaptopyruvate sulfurtransferase
MVKTCLSALLCSLAVWAAPAVRTEMLVSTGWLAQNLNSPDLVVLHVARDRATYDAAHIPGARWLPYGELLVTRDGIPNELPSVDALKAVFEKAGISDNSRIILYGDDMAVYVTRAYFTLDYLGLASRASVLDGGFQKWRTEGKPVTAETPAAAQGKLTPKARPELVATLNQVKAVAEAPAASRSAILLDSRSADDYTGAKPASPTAPAGHIAGAVNLFWFDTQVSRENPALKPAEDIRAMYLKAGVAPGKPVIAYCNSGIQATHAYFTLKYLGYDNVSVFDGSVSEWNSAKGALVK